MTGNDIGDEGARALCDMIGANTALNDLNPASQMIATVHQKKAIETLPK